MPRSSLYHRINVTLSWAFGMVISHGRLTVELAKVVITVTLPPEIKKIAVFSMYSKELLAIDYYSI